ncbi:hypothetical protein ACO0SA_001367 [Hanseniaspora valbyensis]
MEASDRYELIPNGYIYNFIGNTSGVKVLAHISDGGYAQVYKVSYGINNEIGCLKRVIVSSKQALNILRAEVDCMRILKDNSAHIVKYIDSNASRFDSNGKYEVLVLMELCENGSLIDFMNTRLNNRFTEQEILNIFDQTCRGIYAMHRLVPPLLHRDIKIENILINKSNSFKLCDFGSVCGIIRPPKNLEELNFVKNDLLSNTTAQYRPPEILQVAVNNQINIKIDEKSDIWALGVYLYKLCYYTTPFEFNNSGNAGILSGKFAFPDFPKYSHNMKTLISWCLQVDSVKRPNICDLLEQICVFENKPCSLENFYKKRLSMEKQNLEKKHQDQKELLKHKQLQQLQAFKQQQQLMNINDNGGKSVSPTLFPDNGLKSELSTPSLIDLAKTKSLPSVTTSNIESYDNIGGKNLKRATSYAPNKDNKKAKEELEEEVIDPFSDLVTIAKLEKHQYTSTSNFDRLSVSEPEEKPKVPPKPKRKHTYNTTTTTTTLPPKSKTSVKEIPDTKKGSESITQRYKNLLQSEFNVQKSATGYGKYTNSDDDNNKTPIKSGQTKISKSLSSDIKSPPQKPKKPVELKAPPKPKKPASLKAEKLIVLDMETFDKKYPQI